MGIPKLLKLFTNKRIVFIGVRNTMKNEPLIVTNISSCPNHLIDKDGKKPDYILIGWAQ